MQARLQGIDALLIDLGCAEFSVKALTFTKKENNLHCRISKTLNVTIQHVNLPIND